MAMNLLQMNGIEINVPQSQAQNDLLRAPLYGFLSEIV